MFELVGASALRRRLQAAVARGLTRFVGREPELAALTRAREQAGAGHGQVVAVVGEAGVGKSRLVYESVQAHHTPGWLVLESASVSYGKATPYFPVVDLLKRYVHVEDGDEPRIIRAKVTGHILTLDEALQETVPALLALLEALPADSPFLTLDPPQRRQRTLAALKRVLLRESQVQPLLLVNYRPEYQHSWGSKTYYTQLRLDPLPPASAEAFLQALLGDDPGLAPLKRLLIARTEGNPFFLEESVRTLVETAVLVEESGGYRLAKSLDRLQVPATVQAVLAARIDRLAREDKHLLQCAAVIGTEVPFSLVQGIAEVPFSLVQGIAELPEVDHPGSLMLAYYGIGLLSLRQGDRHRAFPLLERALGICQEADLPVYFPWMAAALGPAYTLDGRVADAVPLLTQAMEQAIATERVVYQGLCSLPLGEAHLQAGRLGEAHALAERALALAHAHQERGNQAYALRLLGNIAARREPPEYEPAEAHYRQALALAEELGMRPLTAHCHLGLGTLYLKMGGREAARAELSTAIELYRTMEMTFWLPQADAALVQVD